MLPAITRIVDRLADAPRLQDVSALLAGAVTPLAFAPFGLWPIAVVTPAVLFLLWLRATPARAAWRGWLFGFGMWGAGVYWVYHSLHYFGAAIAPLAALITVLFAVGLALTLAVLGALVARGNPARRGALWLIAIAPAAWVGLEWVRSWLLTGFPWLLLGTAQTNSWLAGWAPVIGVYGVSLFVVLTAGVLAALPRLDNRWRAGLATAVVAVWLAGAGLQTREWTEPDGEALAVALVQGNIEQELKFAAIDLSLDRYEGLTTEAADGVDLVLWPETAVPSGYGRVRDRLEGLAQRLAAQDTELVTGIFTHEPMLGQFYNSVRVVGDNAAVYHKQHLVPFGEYMPLRALLQPFERFIDIPMSDLAAGLPDQPPLRVAGTAFGALICYEAAYTGINRGAARDSGALINVSNDAWFGDSTAPAQHLQMARMRALEVERPMLRATNTGISALIDHRGRVTARGPQFEPTVVRGEIVARAGSTPYQHGGEWPVLIAVLIMLVGGVARMKSRSPDEGRRRRP